MKAQVLNLNTMSQPKQWHLDTQRAVPLNLKITCKLNLMNGKLNLYQMAIDNTVKCASKKQRYDSFLGALSAKSWLNALFRKKGREKLITAPYFCGKCLGYHLSSNTYKNKIKQHGNT